jgi:hypothetical protein
MSLSNVVKVLQLQLSEGHSLITVQHLVLVVVDTTDATHAQCSGNTSCVLHTLPLDIHTGLLYYALMHYHG